VCVRVKYRYVTTVADVNVIKMEKIKDELHVTTSISNSASFYPNEEEFRAKPSGRHLGTTH
jgi:hypothetical protein